MEKLDVNFQNLKYLNLSKQDKEKGHTPLFKNISDFVAFDLETTGFNPTTDEIINVGAIRYRNNMPVAELNILVKPKKAIPSIITEITGISNDMVKDMPSIQEVLPILLDFIGDDIVLGHNVKFDLGFLNYALKTYGFGNYVTSYLDTLTIARSFRKHNKLENLVKDYIDPCFSQEHLALSDAKYTAEIFKIFKMLEIKPISDFLDNNNLSK